MERSAPPSLLDDADDVADQLADLDADEDRASLAQAAPLGRVSPGTWRRGRVPYLLRDVIEARVEVDRAERRLERRVRSAKLHGATWEDLGLALGMSRQGVAKRYG